MEFMPHLAPLVFLMYLGTCCGLAVTGLVTVYGLVFRKWLAVKYGLVVALAGAGTYAALLLAFALTSREKVLGPGELKYFCEVDCHEAYSVTGVSTTKVLGAEPERKTAAGTYYVVSVKVWFDERTISSRRSKIAPLTPNQRSAWVVDERRKQYGLAREGQEALEHMQGRSAALARPLRPGEFYTTTLVFDLPNEIKNPRLYITTEPPFTRFLIGHENSPFHKRVYFALVPAPHTAAARGLARGGDGRQQRRTMQDATERPGIRGSEMAGAGGAFAGHGKRLAQDAGGGGSQAVAA